MILFFFMFSICTTILNSCHFPTPGAFCRSVDVRFKLLFSLMKLSIKKIKKEKSWVTVFLWHLSAEASRGRGSCAEHRGSGEALQQSLPPLRLHQMEGENRRDRTALLPCQQHNHPRVRRWNTGESFSHTKTECLMLTDICRPGFQLYTC